MDTEKSISAATKAFESAPAIAALIAVAVGLMYFNHLQTEGLREDAAASRQEIRDLGTAMRLESLVESRNTRAIMNLVLLNLATESGDGDAAVNILSRYAKLASTTQSHLEDCLAGEMER